MPSGRRDASPEHASGALEQRLTVQVARARRDGAVAGDAAQRTGEPPHSATHSRSKGRAVA